MSEDNNSCGGCVLVLFFYVCMGACFAAWLTHLYVCFHHNRWGFLVAGALFFPIAIVHGIGIWFGVW
jgi:hypothetical protein